MQEVTGLFAGGELDQDDMDEMMKAIQDAYWIAKEKNRKYASKRKEHECKAVLTRRSTRLMS